MTDPIISERLRALLPPLTGEERNQLRENIEAAGKVEEPLAVWRDGHNLVIVDGMHRFDIASSGGYSYTTRERSFDSYDEAEIWMLRHQFGGRNLNPQNAKRLRGELYNRLKKTSKKQESDPSRHFVKQGQKPAAQQVAETADVSTRTAERDGAYVIALGKCEETVQKGVSSRAFKLSDSEVKTMAKLTSTAQSAIARDMRTGKSFDDARKANKIRAPRTTAKKKPPKKLDKPAYYKQWNQAIGPLVRLVDKIAAGVDEKGSRYHVVVQKRLNEATESIQSWMGVKK